MDGRGGFRVFTIRGYTCEILSDLETVKTRKQTHRAAKKLLKKHDRVTVKHGPYGVEVDYHLWKESEEKKDV